MNPTGNTSVTRCLAAILIADVVGYARLMERDDTGTSARLRSVRDEVVDPTIVSHDGRIVKTAGDGLLAEFPSALAALRASVQIQREMAKRNEGVAKEERIDYRIGVNLGDIMVDGSDIVGDGVNVASRLEALAEPGGICVSGSVREQVHGQVAVSFIDIGEQQVKNIERPIQVFAVALAPVDAASSSRRRPWHSLYARLFRSSVPNAAQSRRGRGLGVLAMAVVAVGVAAIWWQSTTPPTPNPPAMSVGIVPLAASAGTMVGRPAEAVRLAHEAIAMDPPGNWLVVRAECEALLLLGKYAEGVTACERATGRSGVNFDIAYFLAAAYAHMGNSSRAREEAAKILKGAPGFTIATLRAKQYSTHPDYTRLAEEHWYSGLRKAGIPEK